MFSRLDRFDVIAPNSATGTVLFVQVDERTEEEFLLQEELSILYALTRVLRPLGNGGRDGVEVLYLCAVPPPDFLRRAVASAGGRLQIHKGPVLSYEGSLGAPEDLADDAFRRLAQRVLRERNAALEEGALVALQREHAEAPYTEDTPDYWTRVLELAAVTGELLRAKRGGRWLKAPLLATIPFAFSHGAEDRSRSLLCNVVDKAERFLAMGEHDGPVGLLRAAEAEDSPGAQPRPVRLMLKASKLPGREAMAHQSLLPWSDSRVELPWLTYGEELPNGFCHLSKDSALAGELGTLHAQALQGLKAVEVQVLESSEGHLKVLAVTGHPDAAEKLVDIDFMRGIHERVGSSLLVAGLPHRGGLLLMNARVKPPVLQAFLKLCETQHKRRGPEPLSSTPVLLHEGRVAGFVWARPDGEAKLVMAPEPPVGLWRGFFNRLFRRGQPGARPRTPRASVPPRAST